MVLAEFDDVDEAAAPIFGRRRLHAGRCRARTTSRSGGCGSSPATRLGSGPARGGARRARRGSSSTPRPTTRSPPIPTSSGARCCAATAGRSTLMERHAVRPGAQLSEDGGSGRRAPRRAAARAGSGSGTAPARARAARTSTRRSPRSSPRARPRPRRRPAAGAGIPPPRTPHAGASIIGVSAIPGQTAFTRIGSSSGATLRTKPTTACFVSE